MDSYIMVAGDSWAVGEWNHGNTHGNTHGGIRKYLEEDGQKTLCFGYPGMGSLTAYDFLSAFIEHNNQKIKIDKLIFFQSDWIRDIRAYRWFNNEHLSVFQKGYSYTRSWYVSSLYYQLSDLYKKHGISSIVIGGQGDTIWIDHFEKEYPGVKIGCQSFTNFIVNNNPRIDRPVHSVFKYGGTSSLFLTQEQFEFVLTQFKSNSTSTELLELIKDMEIAEVRDSIFQDIFPDQMHPDRHAHKKLYHYLQDNKLL